jgi:hypothetical protein
MLDKHSEPHPKLPVFILIPDWGRWWGASSCSISNNNFFLMSFSHHHICPLNYQAQDFEVIKKLVLKFLYTKMYEHELIICEAVVL